MKLGFKPAASDDASFAGIGNVVERAKLYP
jgi:hypothetical protein